MYCPVKAVFQLFCPHPSCLYQYCKSQTELHKIEHPKHVLTLVAVPDSVKVHVVLVVSEEEEAEPGVEGIDRNDEEDPHDVALLPR